MWVVTSESERLRKVIANPPRTGLWPWPDPTNAEIERLKTVLAEVRGIATGMRASTDETQKAFGNLIWSVVADV